MLLDTLLQDLRYALRTLRTSPGFAAVAILSLALGIGANTAIFSLIDAVLLKTLPVSRPEQLVQLTGRGNDFVFTNPQWEEIRKVQDVFSGMLAYGTTRFNLAQGGEERRVLGNYASGSYFSTLGVRTALGRSFSEADDKRGCPAQAVLSYDFWQREYGASPAVLEKTIALDSHPFQVIGVLQPGFFGTDVGLAVDVYTPICNEPIIRGQFSALDQRSSWWLRILARPKPGISPQQALARMNTLAPEIYAATVPPAWRNEYRENYLKRTFQIFPAATGLSFIRAQYRPALITLMFLVGAVLLVACANVANLLLARSAARQREIAIRMALGSGRRRLVRQLLTESTLLSVAGAALGIAFAQWASRLLVTFLNTSYNRVTLDLTLDLRVLAFTATVAVATGILFGIAPAWRGTHVAPQSAMKENSRGLTQDRTRLGLGKLLVAAQVALSLVLLVGAGLLIETFRNLETMDPGFQADHVLIVNADLSHANYSQERLAASRSELLDRIRAIPGVRSATLAGNSPVSGSSWNDELVVDGFVPKTPDDSLVWFYDTYPRLFETLGMQLIAGRDFDDRDRAGAPQVAIINETMAKKFFGADNPIGKSYRIRQSTTELSAPVQIVGVVKDAKYRSLREANLPIGYVPMQQQARVFPFLTFEMRAETSAESLIPGAKSVLENYDRRAVLSFKTLSAQVGESLNRERLLATLSGFFGLLALLLAAIGLYGVMSYNVARRRGEIGIRMALGAEQARVLRMILREITIVVATGLLAGSAAALASTQFVATFLYGLKPRDPATIAIAAMVLAAVAALAGYLPARRASRLDPMTALREE